MAPRNRLRLLPPPSWAKPWGISMIEVMVAMGLTSGLLLVDAERQRSNMVNAKQLQTTNAVTNVITNLQTWLGTEGVIKASFEGEIVSTAALDPELQENTSAHIASATAAVDKAIEDAVAATTALEKAKQEAAAGSATAAEVTEATTKADAAAVAETKAKAALAAAAVPKNLKKVKVGGTVRLKQEKIGEINFIGEPDGSGNIQALDGHNGWAYIKAMWIDNFQQYNTVNIDISGTTIAASEGTANLNVRTWIFTNRLKNSSLDCTTNNNCIKQTHILPLEIRVNSNNNAIIDGIYGVTCRTAMTNPSMPGGTSSAKIPVGEAPNCEDNEFFSVTQTVKATRGNVEAHKGKCCRFLQ